MSTKQTTAAANETIAAIRRIVFQPLDERGAGGRRHETAQRVRRRRDRMCRAAGRDGMCDRVGVPRGPLADLRAVFRQAARRER